MAEQVADIQGELERSRADVPKDEVSYGDRGHSLERIPNGADWMVPESGALVFALSNGAFFLVDADLTIASYPIGGRALAVKLDPGAHADRKATESGDLVRTTTWTFHGIGGTTSKLDKLTVGGRIAYGNGDYCDQREAFARALARLAGWRFRELDVRRHF